MKTPSLRSIVFTLTAVVAVLPSVGCTHTEAGAGVGALFGGLVGAAVGGRKALPAAAIGAAGGALVGGALGAGQDKAERRAVAAAQARMLPISEVIELTRNGASDSMIITQIRTTGSVYHLSGQDLLMLQQNGVREPVIREMQESGRRRAIVPVAAVPVYEPAPVMVVRPCPPPPPVGLGFTYIHHRR